MKSVIIYNVWMLVQIMDVIGSVLVSWYLIKLRQRFSRYIAAVFICISLEAVIAATALYLFWEPDMRVSLVFVCFRIAGRALKATSLWFMLLYCLGYLNGDDSKDDTDATA